MVCPLCGFANAPETSHCLSCGTPLQRARPAQSNPPAQPPEQPIPAPERVVLPVAAVAAAAAAPMFAPTAGQQQDPLPPRPPRPERAYQPEASVYAPVLGPANRESFFAAQARHRRATWRLTAICVVAAIIVGIPISIALTPVLYAAIIVLTKLTDIIMPVPGFVWDAYVWAGRLLPDTIEALDDPSTPGVSEGDIGRVPTSKIFWAAIIWFAPGIIAMLAIWPVLRRLFEYGGVGGVLLTLGAREPQIGDFEERQLVNVVEELAVAAGLPAPQVRLIDSSVANAAVVGSSRHDATIVVSRSLLDDLNRDETQGVLAHLIASIGNGDLRGARSIIAIFETFGLASLVLKAPISSSARRALWRVVRYVFGKHTTATRARESQAVAGLLTRDAFDNETDDFQWLAENQVAPKERPGPSLRLLLYFPMFFLGVFIMTVILDFSSEMRRLMLFGVIGLAIWLVWYQREFARYSFNYGRRVIRVLIMLPYYMGVMMPQIILMFLFPFVLEPLIALLWRTRRYLADATAVQLTRNPDSIARGLTGLVARGGIIPGGHWAAPLFVVGPEATNLRAQYAQSQRMQKAMEEELRANQNAEAGGARGLAAEMRAFREVGQREAIGHIMAAHEAEQRGEKSGLVSFGGDSPPMIAFHPALNRRLAKLRRMGATVADAPMRQRPAVQVVSSQMRIGISALLIVLWAVVAVLSVAVIVLLLALSLFFCSIMMLVVYGLLIVLLP